jgi:osmoprotectant transport system permease protein
MKRMLLIAVALATIAVWPRPAAPPSVRIGSKVFTESVILGEVLTQLIEDGGDRATHVAKIGSTQIVFDALERGEIDAYPEYTGTLRKEIFAGRDVETTEQLEALLRARGIAISRSLGFSNSYALAVTRETAQRLELAKISDLARHPDLRVRVSSEFVQRSDGWKNLRATYGLSQQAEGMDHDLAFRHLIAGQIDVTDVYTTEARIAEFDVVLLEDDRHYFPPYDAVILSRVDLADRYPSAAERIATLGGRIDRDQMMKLNAEVELYDATESRAAAQFLREELSIDAAVEDQSVASQIGQRTWEHLDLVRRSLIPAIFVAIPLGVFAAKWPRSGRAVLGAVGVVQTIPALALLVLLIAPLAYFDFKTLGAGSATAIVALFLYSLLPIVQNTAAGIAGIAPEHRESAEALGLPAWFRLLHVELPLATPSILAGVKTAAVLNVGFATLGALVGARGYGQPILDGIRVANTVLILQGAIPAACMALVLQLGFELAERWLVPAGLRLSSQRREG